MRRRLHLFFLGAGLGLAVVAIGLCPATDGAHAQIGTVLEFVVSGLRSSTGTLRGGIYASQDGWTEVGRQVAVCTSPVSGGTARCRIFPPGPGRYAFAFYHDADDDHQLDRDMVGVPQEGYGFSNNVRPGLGAPSFDSAAFNVAAGETYTGRITALYGINL